jgi:hypothetical protein
MTRVNQITIERIWRRLAQESNSPFLLRMDNAEFTAIDLYGGPGSGYVLRSDGVVAKWNYESLAAGVEYEVELDHGWCVGALVIGAKRIPELKEVLPVRPVWTQHCAECNGQGFTDLPNAPKFLLCQKCWGLGWCA